MKQSTAKSEAAIALFFIFLFLYIIFFASCASPKEIYTETVITATTIVLDEEPEYVILNDDNFKEFNLSPDSLYKIRLFLGGKIFGTKTVPDKKNITIVDGIVFQKNINSVTDTIFADELTEVDILGVFQDKKLGTVLQVSLEPDATIQNKKFGLFALKKGIFQIVLEDEFFFYMGEKFFISNSPNAILLLLVKQEKDEKSGVLKILKGKKN